ncbi:reverse transcriptase, partial [Pseudoloma neurophilia]
LNDYRKLNKITENDPFPSLIMDEMLNNLEGSIIFSTIDFNKGHYKIEIDKKDIEKTGFTIVERPYEFLDYQWD